MQKINRILNLLVALLRRQKKTILLVTVVAAVTLLLSGIVAILLSNVDNVSFPSVGTIRTSGIKAYWDVGLTDETKEIPWGQLSPGSSANAILYLRSISNMEITLEMTAINWTFRNSIHEIVYGPANSTQYLILSWDYDGSTMKAGQVIQIVFTLHVENTPDFVEYVIEKDVQSFSFDINIRALE